MPPSLLFPSRAHPSKVHHAQTPPTPARPPEREVTNSASGLSNPQLHAPTPRKHRLPQHPSTPNNLFRHPTNGNPAPRKLSRRAAELGPATGHGGAAHEVVLFDCGFACDYGAAGEGGVEEVEEGESGDAAGRGAGSGEEYGVLSEFGRFLFWVLFLLIFEGVGCEGGDGAVED